MRATDPTWSPFGGQLAQVHQLPRPTRTRASTRWLWAVPIVIGILTVAGWVLSHDTAPGGALSRRSWITLAAAATVAILLVAHRRRGGGRLALRVALEYGAVALVVALVTTAPAAREQHSPAKPKTHQSRAEAIAGACPSVSRPVAWASCVWAEASRTATHTQSPTTTRKGKHP
jgi:hypothetical protein